jgi:hypothetical protein
MSLCSIFTVPGDNSNRLKDKKKPRTTVKKFLISKEKLGKNNFLWRPNMLQYVTVS